MITEDYVSFELAQLLKEKGFDGECRAFWKDWKGEIRLCSCNNAHMFEYCHNSMLERYNDTEETNIAAPTLQMAMKWLREVHKIHISGEMGFDIDNHQYYFFIPSVCRFSDKSGEYENPFGEKEFDTYEEAAGEAIRYCLENLI